MHPAYLAGLIDAEGCFCLTKNFRSQLSINMTHRSIIELVASHWGVSVTAQARTEGSRWKDTYRAMVCHRRRLIPVIQEVQPYLLLKREQAAKVLMFCASTNRDEQKKLIQEVALLNARKVDKDIDITGMVAGDILIEYWAGFFDGEGCLRIRKSYNRTYSLSASINVREGNILELIRSVFGGSLERNAFNGIGAAKCSRWGLGVTQGLQEFIKKMGSLVVVKSPQFNVAQKFLSLPHGSPEKKVLYEQMGILNYRGIRPHGDTQLASFG